MKSRSSKALAHLSVQLETATAPAPLTPVRQPAFGTMPGGPLDDRLVGFSIADGEETNAEYINIGGALVVYAPPVAASRVVSVVTQAQIDAGATDPLGTEMDLDPGFGAHIVSTPWTVRAYAADATILDEQTFE